MKTAWAAPWYSAVSGHLVTRPSLAQGESTFSHGALSLVNAPLHGNRTNDEMLNASMDIPSEEKHRNVE